MCPRDVTRTPCIIRDGEQEITEHENIANTFNEYFTNIVMAVNTLVTVKTHENNNNTHNSNILSVTSYRYIILDTRNQTAHGVQSTHGPPFSQNHS